MAFLFVDGSRWKRHLALTAAVCAFFGTATASHAEEGHKVHTVVIEGMRFSPQTIEVNAGDTVIWENKDFFPHTATADDRSFDSRDIPSNRSWKFVAKKKGTFPYLCKLHPGMKGLLVVK